MSSAFLNAAASAGARTAANIGTQLLVSSATTAIGRAFDNRNFEAPRLERFRIMSSTDGAPLPRVWGRVRLGGQVVWASKLKETRTTEKVGKGGGPTRTDYTYSISFAVALCEGEIAGVERIWANGEPLANSGVSFRVYRGTEDQDPDPIMTAIDGDVPAFRGTAYIVFEDFPLDAYGSRLPQINAEVIRTLDRSHDGETLESLVTGVNLLPSSGEFAYQPTVVEESPRPGEARPINVNNVTGQPDVELALDQLEAQLPNCASVSIISSWFGTDLRLSECRIHPGVETQTRPVIGTDWSVGGIGRKDAYVVSETGAGNPVYGGTPSDKSLIDLIRRLKERGYEVGLYPFILMDIPPGNELPDPYGGSEQGAFPWRGRITGQGGDVAGFFGSASASDFGASSDEVTYDGPEEFAFRRFILHHAQIAAAAGGVDRFSIGSEMVGLTQAGAETGYPAVAELRDLAAEVRKLLPEAKIAYCADWTEYRGHQQGGAITYQLDDLWADPNIDLVGIDAYFPLSDFREGSNHADAERAVSVHDLGYLSSNVEGGELYDWFYASRADRDIQLRTPISDPVYRIKDVRSWWGSEHRNRDADGIPDPVPTAWRPGMKPIWFSEIGCPAIDMGSNQPNVFVDPKSSESEMPFFSAGTRDDLIQRNYLRAFLSHYQDDPMVEASHVWCWDARPYPDFPARRDVWADGPNWQLGHWLTGRTGRIALADIIHDVCRGVGVAADVSQVTGMVEGFVLDRALSARAALENLCAAFGVDVFEAPDKIVFRSDVFHPQKAIRPDDLLDAPIEVMQLDASDMPGDVQLHYIDAGRDHQPALASGARRIGAHNPSSVNLPVVMDEGLAQLLARRMLRTVTRRTSRLTCSLAMDTDVCVGDTVTLPDGPRRYLVTELEQRPDGSREVSAIFVGLAESPPGQLLVGGDAPVQPPPIAWTPAPALFGFDLPTGFHIGARVEPFTTVEATVEGVEVDLSLPAHIAALDSPIRAGSAALPDEASLFEIAGLDVGLEALTHAQWLKAGNRFAVETSSGWEIIAIREMVLVAPGKYRCRGLLRGLNGSDPVDHAAGARIVWLDKGLFPVPVTAEPSARVRIEASAAGREADPVELSYLGHGLRPLSPGHLSIHREGETFRVSFHPRRREAGSWSGFDDVDGGRYLVEALDGETLVESIETSEPRAQLSATGLTHVRVREGARDYGWGDAAVTAV